MTDQFLDCRPDRAEKRMVALIGRKSGSWVFDNARREGFAIVVELIDEDTGVTAEYDINCFAASGASMLAQMEAMFA